MRAFFEPAQEQRLAQLQSISLDEFAVSSDQQARLLTPKAIRWMAEQGWLEHLRLPNNSRDICLVREAIAGRSPLLDCLFAVQGLATVPLQLEGDPQLRQEFLEPALQGRRVGGFALTEPEAGSDVANLQTRAIPDGHHYRLEGHKWLISNAGVADYFVVFASLEPEARSRGIAAFVVESQAEGFEFAGPQILSAPHPLGQLRFHGCKAQLLHREGFKLAMRTLDTMRVSVAASACGMAWAALDSAARHVLQRRQFGQPMADFQLVQQKLAQMEIGLESSRLLTYQAAFQRDQGLLRNTREVAMAKAFATETAQQVIDSAMQLCGGLGMLAEHPAEYLYRAIRALRVYEGATEVQYLIIAKDLLKRYVDTPAAATR